MSEKNSREDKFKLAVPGGGPFGVGFFFIPASIFGVTSVFAFTGCIVGGLGLGLFAAAVLSNNRKGS